MRTTINLPNDLLRQAKRAALDADITLTEFIADAVRMRLARKKQAEEKPYPPMPTWAPPPGEEGWQPGVDLDDTASLLDLMDQYDADHRR